jgi:hypothetical protein
VTRRRGRLVCWRWEAVDFRFHFRYLFLLILWFYSKPYDMIDCPVAMSLLDRYMKKCPFNATCGNLITKIIVCAGKSIPEHRGQLFRAVCWFSLTFSFVTFN